MFVGAFGCLKAHSLDRKEKKRNAIICFPEMSIACLRYLEQWLVEPAVMDQTASVFRG